MKQQSLSDDVLEEIFLHLDYRFIVNTVSLLNKQCHHFVHQQNTWQRICEHQNISLSVHKQDQKSFIDRMKPCGLMIQDVETLEYCEPFVISVHCLEDVELKNSTLLFPCLKKVVVSDTSQLLSSLMTSSGPQIKSLKITSRTRWPFNALNVQVTTLTGLEHYSGPDWPYSIDFVKNNAANFKSLHLRHRVLRMKARPSAIALDLYLQLDLPNLTSLRTSEMTCKTIPPILELPRLKTLSVCGTPLQLGNLLSVQMPNLRCLIVQMKLGTMSQNIPKLDKLRKLVIYMYIPNKIRLLESVSEDLEDLSLEISKLVEVIELLRKFKSLRMLTLHARTSEECPDSLYKFIDQNPELHTLELKNIENVDQDRIPGRIQLIRSS